MKNRRFLPLISMIFLGGFRCCSWAMDKDPELASFFHGVEETRLHEIARLGYGKEILNDLFEEGCDVNATNHYGLTALHIASFFKYADIVKILIEDYNADVNVKSISGKNPLYWAIHFGSNAEVEQLLLKHTDLDTEDEESTVNVDVVPDEVSNSRFHMTVPTFILTGIARIGGVVSKLFGR